MPSNDLKKAQEFVREKCKVEKGAEVTLSHVMRGLSKTRGNFANLYIHANGGFARQIFNERAGVLEEEYFCIYWYFFTMQKKVKSFVDQPVKTQRFIAEALGFKEEVRDGE